MDCSDHNEVSVVIDNADSEEGDSEQEENVHYTPRRKIFYYPYSVDSANIFAPFLFRLP